jgi:hypothetical protein
VTSYEDNDSAKLRKQIDHDDLNREMAGLDYGRMRRFLHHTLNEQERSEKRRNAEDIYLTALQILLLSPDYAQAYAEARQFLGAEKTAIEEARHRLLEQLSSTEADLTKLRANASRLEDGTLVFAGESGTLIDEHGNILDAAQRENIALSDNTPRWSDYADAKEKLRTLRNELEEVEDYEQEIVLPALDKIDDPENPYSLDVINDLQRKIENERPDSILQIVEAKQLGKASVVGIEPNRSMTEEYGLDESELEKREVASSFDKARLDIPDIDEMEIDDSNNLEVDIKPI